MPSGSDAVEIVSGVTAAAIASARALVAVCTEELESFDWTVNENDPEADGVPLMTPLDAFKVKPVGNVPDDTDQL